MTTSELIAALSEFPPDAPVFVCKWERYNQVAPVDRVYTSTVEDRRNSIGYPWLTRPGGTYGREERCVSGVILANDELDLSE